MKYLPFLRFLQSLYPSSSSSLPPSQAIEEIDIQELLLQLAEFLKATATAPTAKEER